MKAIIVDDEPLNRAFLGRILSREGWICQAFDAVEAAVESARATNFDLAFLDVHIGDGPDGFWLAGQLQGLQSDLAIVMMSGSPDQEDRAKRAGLDPILLKPFAAEAVCAVLRACEDDRRSL